MVCGLVDVVDEAVIPPGAAPRTGDRCVSRSSDSNTASSGETAASPSRASAAKAGPPGEVSPLMAPEPVSRSRSRMRAAIRFSAGASGPGPGPRGGSFARRSWSAKRSGSCPSWGKNGGASRPDDGLDPLRQRESHLVVCWTSRLDEGRDPLGHVERDDVVTPPVGVDRTVVGLVRPLRRERLVTDVVIGRVSTGVGFPGRPRGEQCLGQVNAAEP